MEWYPGTQSPCQNWSFVNTSKKLLKNGNQTFPIGRHFTWKVELASNILWMIVATPFISSTRRIFTKLLGVKVRSQRTLSIILLTSGVICKQRLFHGNEIVRYLQNCKCYNVDQDHFGKVLTGCLKLLFFIIRTLFKAPFNEH